MENFTCFNGIKYIDMPLPIGGFIDVPIDSLYDKLLLELGSIYYFNVYYCNNPLTKNGVPYNPVKLRILDIKDPIDIIRSVYESEQTHDYICVDSLIKQLKNNFLRITSKVILDCAITNMVNKSDLIKDIRDKDYAKYIGTLDCLENEGPKKEGVTRHYVLNLTLAYFKTMV